jgi:hypothetical protein
MNNDWQDTLSNFAVTAALGGVGRLVALARDNRRPWSWNLLWELPVACMMGLIGDGIGGYFDLHNSVHIAVIVGVSYLGPRVLDEIFTRALSVITR